MGLNRWSLGKLILRRIARAQGFPDPIDIFASLGRFARPAEVWVPTELLRSGAVMQARGLMNTQAIQNNPDWIWPFWAEKQFDPESDSFIPRAFNLTHINLTHRNWTALGIPGLPEFPLVDPRGLVTPHFDGWSLDFWIWRDAAHALVPSRCAEAAQTLRVLDDHLTVTTHLHHTDFDLELRSDVTFEEGVPVCRVFANALSVTDAKFVISVRPCNPEGVSFVYDLKLLEGSKGWKVDGRREVRLDRLPERYVFSDYTEGDVFNQLAKHPLHNAKTEIRCDVGLASSAAVFDMEPGKPCLVTARMPLKAPSSSHPLTGWDQSLENTCRIEIPDAHYAELFQNALSSFVLLSPDDVYPGPYTYRRFWFRDAAFILYAMITTGLVSRAEKVLDRFEHRQTPTGYFVSQNGEWDSNGQALWVLERFCALTGLPPKKNWNGPVSRGAAWIQRKRTHKDGSAHAGLLPPGFSAEHFGPNDYYYWDDFWGVAGLKAAAALMRAAGELKKAETFEGEAADLLKSIDQSIDTTSHKLDTLAASASPYRRMDFGAIGVLSAAYPLQLLDAEDARLKETVDYILKHCFVRHGFYQEINHSGINAYLTLHVAQVLLRRNDPRFEPIVRAIAKWASPTGQWPEAIHPRTGGGCMGDGQHLWAAAEWVLMMRNMFVREEEATNTLILGSGLPSSWINEKGKLFLGPVLTSFGKISVTIRAGENTQISWEARWHKTPSSIEIRLTGYTVLQASPSESASVAMKKKEKTP